LPVQRGKKLSAEHEQRDPISWPIETAARVDD
jgi:hypothetical protein